MQQPSLLSKELRGREHGGVKRSTLNLDHSFPFLVGPFIAFVLRAKRPVFSIFIHRQILIE